MTIKFLIATSVACLFVGLVPQADAFDLTGASGLVDFDWAFGFHEPKTIAVFRSADPAQPHLYFLVPNSIQLSKSQAGEPQTSLIYESTKIKAGAISGYLTAVVVPVIDSA